MGVEARASHLSILIHVVLAVLPLKPVFKATILDPSIPKPSNLQSIHHNSFLLGLISSPFIHGSSPTSGDCLCKLVTSLHTLRLHLHATQSRGMHKTGPMCTNVPLRLLTQQSSCSLDASKECGRETTALSNSCLTLLSFHCPALNPADIEAAVHSFCCLSGVLLHGTEIHHADGHGDPHSALRCSSCVSFLCFMILSMTSPYQCLRR